MISGRRTVCHTPSGVRTFTTALGQVNHLVGLAKIEKPDTSLRIRIDTIDSAGTSWTSLPRDTRKLILSNSWHLVAVTADQ